MSRRRFRAFALCLAPALAGCNATPASPTGAVDFLLDAPFCGLTMPVSFAIDGQPVGVDTFRVGVVYGPPARLRSRPFTVTPGDHLLSATEVPFNYVWPSVTRHVEPGATITDTLPFYCS